MSPADELGLLLRPAGGGLYLVSSGLEEQERLQRELYRARDRAEIDAQFQETLASLRDARAVVLGIPSDTGAGFRRGANQGPLAIRVELARRGFFERWRARGLVDVGDVFVVPQLQTDEMLSDAQLARTRAALYPGRDEPLPVSPLSIASRALALMLGENPRLKVFAIGGDHSTAWPVFDAVRATWPGRLGVVQFDAHTDLLPSRLGVELCFATWSYHANERLGRDGRLVQVGVRASRHPREHWESTLGVRQLWAAECNADPDAAVSAVLAHLERVGVDAVYLSNDIDGTDAAFADATGTPEPGGLSPELVSRMIAEVGARFPLVGGDVMEVAPALSATTTTVELATRYFEQTVEAALGPHRAPGTRNLEIPRGSDVVPDGLPMRTLARDDDTFGACSGPGDGVRGGARAKPG